MMKDMDIKSAEATIFLNLYKSLKNVNIVCFKSI